MDPTSPNYPPQVWEQIEKTLGKLPPETKAHCAMLIRAMGEMQVPVDAASELISDQINQSAHRFRQGMDTFQLLGQAIERIGEAIEEKSHMATLMDTMLHLKRGMAQLYHELAVLAPQAGVPDFTSPEEISEELARANEELAHWIATRENYGYPSDDNGSE